MRGGHQKRASKNDGEGVSSQGGWWGEKASKQRAQDDARKRVSKSCHSMFPPLPFERIVSDCFRVSAIKKCDATGGHVRDGYKTPAASCSVPVTPRLPESRSVVRPTLRPRRCLPPFPKRREMLAHPVRLYKIKGHKPGPRAAAHRPTAYNLL